MSIYSNLIDCLSDRCNQIMTKHYNKLKEDNLEVTFLLMLATTGFTIPNERLDKLENKGDPRTIKKFKEDVFNKLQKENIIFAKVIKKDSYHLFEDYEKESESSKIEQISEFLSIIRNALAHGSIFFIDDKEGNIKEVAFVSENRKKSNKCLECNNAQNILDERHPYKYIHFKKIEDFKIFLELWFKFLQP